MRRREFITLLCGTAIAWPIAGRAQQPAAVPRIGMLTTADREPFWGLFVAELGALGYADGRNIALMFRSAEGKSGLLPDLAAELVRLKVDIIVANQTPAVLAAKQATGTIPIVMAGAGDPLGTGLIASFSRPGGNVTGMASATWELTGKTIELIREILPAASRVAVLANAADLFTRTFLGEIELAARVKGIRLQPIQVRGVEEFDAAFAAMEREKANAVIVQPSLPRQRAIDLALKHRLPSVSPTAAFTAAGGLISYSANVRELYAKAAIYVDKILKGQKAADLPVEVSTRFELRINLKTAKALGLVIPPTLLARADEVIE